MDSGVSTALLSGGFALGGALGGVLLSARMQKGTDRARLEAEDARRWLGERRVSYAAYLGHAASMLQEIDGVGIFLSERGNPDFPPEQDEQWITDGLYDYFDKWESVLQPALGEVQLLASPAVADLADRVSSALMDITAPIEKRSSFDAFYPGWFQARDLLQVLRNAMRSELGLGPMADSPFPRDPDWPWLADRPPRESYIQGRTSA